MTSVFKQRVERNKKINALLKPYNLETGTYGSIFDPELPLKGGIVSGVTEDDIVITSSDTFLEKNPIIAHHIATGRSEIVQKFKNDQAEAKAWANRPI